MYIYNDIAFRPINREDLEILRKLHNDQTTFLNLLNIDLVDEIGQIKWWESLHKKDNDKRYVIMKAENPKQIIGRLRIQNINHLHRNCEVGLDILPELRGKGYGIKSYRMLLEFLFKHYNMNMVYLKVAEFNPKAKKLYEKIGFTQTGYLPKYFYRHGKYWDYLIFVIMKKDFFNLLSKQK